MASMEMGVFFTAGEDAVDIARVARAAEERGFGSLWVGEHVVMPVEYERVYPASESDGEAPEFAALISSPLIALARAAAVTERLRIGTGRKPAAPPRAHLAREGHRDPRPRFRRDASCSEWGPAGCARRRRSWAATSIAAGVRSQMPSPP